MLSQVHSSPCRGRSIARKRNREGVTAATDADACGTAAHPTPRPIGRDPPPAGEGEACALVLAMRSHPSFANG